MTTTYQRCPFQMRSTLASIAGEAPDACTPTCKLAQTVTGPNGQVVGHQCAVMTIAIALYNLDAASQARIASTPSNDAPGKVN